MRKVGFIVFISLTILIFFFYILDEKQILDEEKNVEKKMDDFILHMKVERDENGVVVHQSLQYVGEDTVEIFHQTPLISVSLSNNNHDFTGSLVQKNLRKGSIYHQETVKIPVNKKGENKLFVEAKFLVGEKIVRIEHLESLMFN